MYLVLNMFNGVVISLAVSYSWLFKFQHAIQTWVMGPCKLVDTETWDYENETVVLYWIGMLSNVVSRC